MKAIRPKHMRTCRKKAAIVVDTPAEDLIRAKLDHERNLWPVIPEPEQLTIAEYMDVVSVCRTDSGG